MSSQSFPLDSFSICSCKVRKHGDGQVDWKMFITPQASEKTPGWTCYLRIPWVKSEDKTSIMLMCPEKSKKGEAEVRNFWIRSYQQQEKSGMPHMWQPTMRLFPSSDNLTTLMFTCCNWSQRSSDRTTYKFPFSPRSGCYCVHVWSSKGSICGIVLYAEKFKGESFIPSE